MSHLLTYNLPNKTTCKILTYLYNMTTKYWKLSIEILMAAESLISIAVKDHHMAELQTFYLVCLPQAITLSNVQIKYLLLLPSCWQVY